MGAGKCNSIVTRQWTCELVDCIGNQSLTFLGRDVNKVAVAIQLGHFLKQFKQKQCAGSVQNQVEAMSRKRANDET